MADCMTTNTLNDLHKNTYQLLLHSRMLLFSLGQITLESILIRLCRPDLVLQCRSGIVNSSSHCVGRNKASILELA